MSKRNIFFVANWKMGLLPEKESLLLEGMPRLLAKKRKNLKVIVCPSFLSLTRAANIQKYSKSVFEIGAQDCHWEEEGPYTGEISAKALFSIGCTYVLIGHSERRTHFQEDERIVNKKLQAAFNAGLKPILCIGETQQERDSGNTFERLRGQLSSAFHGCAIRRNQAIYIAYEPVWAIGTGTPLKIEELAKVISYIKGWIASNLSLHPHGVLYGGSVDEKIVLEYLSSESGVDGLLVGSASQSVKSFSKMLSCLTLVN